MWLFSMKAWLNTIEQEAIWRRQFWKQEWFLTERKKFRIRFLSVTLLSFNACLSAYRIHLLTLRFPSVYISLISILMLYVLSLSSSFILTSFSSFNRSLLKVFVQSCSFLSLLKLEERLRTYQTLEMRKFPFHPKTLCCTSHFVRGMSSLIHNLSTLVSNRRESLISETETKLQTNPYESRIPKEDSVVRN
jgi:hypothetical protein